MKEFATGKLHGNAPRACAINHIEQRPECLLLAQCGHSTTEFRCPLSGVKRTCAETSFYGGGAAQWRPRLSFGCVPTHPWRYASMSAFDPKRTMAFPLCCDAQQWPLRMAMTLMPVKLPPGRFRFSTRPSKLRDLSSQTCGISRRFMGSSQPSPGREEATEISRRSAAERPIGAPA